MTHIYYRICVNKEFNKLMVIFLLQYNATRERYDAQNLHHSPPDGGESIPNSELESARPQTAGEEELQLQLALAMSREEAEQEETKNKSDDMRLQLALQKSKT